MRKHHITLLPGDGIGPEITSVTKYVLETLGKKVGFEISFQDKVFGGAAIDSTGSPESNI